MTSIHDMLRDPVYWLLTLYIAGAFATFRHVAKIPMLPPFVPDILARIVWVAGWPWFLFDSFVHMLWSRVEK